MKDIFFRFLPYMIILITLYITILCIQWTYESKETYLVLLEDIVQYDLKVLQEAKNDKKNINGHIDIFIEMEDINYGVWLSKWNIFDWSEGKYIHDKNKNKILKNLNYWRITGELPTLYNLNIKST